MVPKVGSTAPFLPGVGVDAGKIHGGGEGKERCRGYRNSLNKVFFLFGGTGGGGDGARNVA